VYMMKSSGPRTEIWGTPQEVYKDEKVLLHMTQKERDDKYDLNQLKTEPWMPNHNERRVRCYCYGHGRRRKRQQKGRGDTDMITFVILLH